MEPVIFEDNENIEEEDELPSQLKAFVELVNKKDLFKMLTKETHD